MDLPIVLNRNSAVPLKRQLYDEIRRLILTGHWRPGHRFPSVRILAEKLEISRPTINWACGQLLTEVYPQSFVGTGTFVNRELREEFLPVNKSNTKPNQTEPFLTPELSHWGNYLLSWPGSEATFAATAFNANELNALNRDGIVFGPSSGKDFLDLQKGFVLFMPASNVSVQTREGLVSINKGCAA